MRQSLLTPEQSGLAPPTQSIPLILFVSVAIKSLVELGRRYEWPKDLVCPECGSRLWGHGFVQAWFDGCPQAVRLARYRCAANVARFPGPPGRLPEQIPGFHFRYPREPFPSLESPPMAIRPFPFPSAPLAERPKKADPRPMGCRLGGKFSGSLRSVMPGGYSRREPVDLIRAPSLD